MAATKLMSMGVFRADTSIIGAMDMLKYYNERNIIPVHQDIVKSDFGRFRFQREMLYSNLGIQPSYFTGKDVAEFGPGTGDNATIIMQNNPRSITLIDGNVSSLEALRKKIEQGVLDPKVCKIIDSSVMNYGVGNESASQYDVVISEGMINGNENPDKIVNHLFKMVKPGGVLIVTSVSPWGVVDQAVRRVFLPAINNIASSYFEAVQIGSGIFKSHLSNLPTSKPIGDWVQDAVLHPLTSNYIFDAEDVIDSIKQSEGNLGVIIGSSPRFFQDFRWFKSLSVTSDSTNTIFVNQFRNISPLFIDSRLESSSGLEPYIERISNSDENNLPRQIWNLSCDIAESNSYEKLTLFIDKLNELAGLLEGFPYIRGIVDELELSLPSVADGNIGLPLPHFSSWWGRGLQYIALRKLHDV